MEVPDICRSHLMAERCSQITAKRAGDQSPLRVTWFLPVDEEVSHDGRNLNRLNKKGISQLGEVSLECRAKQQELLGLHFIPTRERRASGGGRRTRVRGSPSGRRALQRDSSWLSGIFTAQVTWSSKTPASLFQIHVLPMSKLTPPKKRFLDGIAPNFIQGHTLPMQPHLRRRPLSTGRSR